jgi:putative transposase
MARGNRKSCIFDDDDDRRFFLADLADATSRFDVACYAYCLMGNHYHLVVATPRGNLSTAMRQVNGCYAQGWNRRHHHSGHLFEGRFKSIAVEREAYFRDLVRYVALNPVRAGLVEDPAAWPWSSYRASAGLAPPPWFLDVSWIQGIFGGVGQLEAQIRYRLHVNEGLTEATEIDPRRLTLGTLHFDRAVRSHLEADRVDKPLPRAHRALGRPLLNELFGLPGQSRAERNRLIREAHVRYGYTLREIGIFLRLHPRTPSAILRKL